MFSLCQPSVVPAAKKHFGTQNCVIQLCVARKIVAYKQSGMFLNENLTMSLRNVFSAFQEKINGESFFFSWTHLMYTEG